MTVFIIRHAHKEKGDFYNARLRHQDPPISRHGQEASRKLWSYLCDKSISAVYVSGYRRTAETIAYVAGRLHLSPIIDDRLNEIDNGSLENMSEQEIKREYPELWRLFQARTADFRFPGGETGEEACHRFAEFLEEKRQVHRDHNIVLLSHEGVIRLLMCHIMNLPVYRRGNFYVDYCGITEIVYEEPYRCWKLIRFNQTIT